MASEAAVHVENGDHQDESGPHVVCPKDLIALPKLVSLATSRQSEMGAAAFCVKKYDAAANKSAIDVYVNYVDGNKY
jgi:hypothetical protein